jgi:hypothetical protein
MAHVRELKEQQKYTTSIQEPGWETYGMKMCYRLKYLRI